MDDDAPLDSSPDPIRAKAEPTTELVVRRVDESSPAVWRDRVVAFRAVLPRLVRNPVVVGASAAAATVAARVALDAALRVLGTPAPPRRLSVTVTGSVVHHVVHHHVVHHVGPAASDLLARRALPPAGS